MDKKIGKFIDKKIIILSFLFLAVKTVFFHAFDGINGTLSVVWQLVAILAEEAVFLALFLILAGEKKSELLYLLLLLNPFSTAWFGVRFLAQLLLVVVFLLIELKAKGKTVKSIVTLLISFSIVFIDRSAIFSIVTFIFVLIIANRKMFKESLFDLFCSAIGIASACIIYNKITTLRSFLDNIDAENQKFSFLKPKVFPQDMHTHNIIVAVAALILTLLLLTIAINSQKKMERRYASSGKKFKNGLSEKHADKTLALIFIPSVMAIIGAAFNQNAALAFLGITPIMILLLLAREEDLFSLSLINYLEYFWDKRMILTCFCLAGYCAVSFFIYSTDVLFSGATYLVP